jgi:hypothetical protein
MEINWKIYHKHQKFYRFVCTVDIFTQWKSSIIQKFTMITSALLCNSFSWDFDVRYSSITYTFGFNGKWAKEPIELKKLGFLDCINFHTSSTSLSVKKKVAFTQSGKRIDVWWCKPKLFNFWVLRGSLYYTKTLWKTGNFVYHGNREHYFGCWPFAKQTE